MIREANLKDIDIIVELGLNYDKKFLIHHNIDFYLNNPNYVVVVAEDCKKIVGFVIATKIYDVVEILLIYVTEQFRKKGIATNLINSLFQNDVEKMLLEVSVENYSAISLYKKLGFIVIGERKKYYNGVDALVMERKCL